LSRTNVAWRRALWRAKTFGRGMQGHKPFFHVIEFWLENRLTIEVVSPAMAGIRGPGEGRPAVDDE